MPYSRPLLSTPVFRDATGAVIEYGNRWGAESPPTESYSVVTHPERFAPLHDVADALIAHLLASFDATVDEDPDPAPDLPLPRADILRTRHVAPARDGAAALTFAFTRFPGVVVQAGMLAEFLFPVCGCDACDEDWERGADELEDAVLAVAAGRFTEWWSAGPPTTAGHAFWTDDGRRSSWGQSSERELERARRAQLPAEWRRSWAPWD